MANKPLKTLTFSGLDGTYELSSLPLYVTMTGNEQDGYVVDKTYQEINAAYESGRSVYCVYYTTIFSLGGITPSLAAFSVTFNNSYRRIFVYSDESKPVKYETLTFAVENENKDFTDEIYFNITDSGVISLRAEYQKDGIQNKELPEKIVIPEAVNGIKVSALSVAMFNGNKRVKSITLPSTVDAIPEAFCNNAWNLEEVLNTEKIKSLGSHAFAKSGIRKAFFPNLTTFPNRSNGNAPSSHFSFCANLVVADLGLVFSESGSSIPAHCFANCEKLVCIRNSDGVTSVGDYGLYMTRRIENLTFLPNLKSIGNYGLLLSRADYDWDKLKDCTFGTLSTSRDINTTDYSQCVFTPCNLPIRSTFEQHNPKWADKYVGNSQNKYTTGCATVAAAMIYSALMGVDMESPEEFVDAVGAVNKDLINFDISDGVNNTTGEGDFWGELVLWFNAVNLDATIYDSVSAENIQTMYNSLNQGCMVWARILGDYLETNHCVAFHGVNENGEVLVVDSSAASREIGIYEAATYSMPIQNFMRDHGDVDHFIVVKKK